MFQKQLRKEFTRALCKATLLALLPLSLATMGAAASAQQTENQFPTEQQVVTQDTVLVEEGKTITVDPQNAISVESVEARYPFLKSMMDQLREFNKDREEDLLAQTIILTSTVRDAQQGVDITVVSVEGPLTCGASQCYVGIYIDKGEGYKQAFAGTAPLPVKILKQNDEMSFFFCSSSAGRAQWTLKGDTLEHQGNLTSPQIGPSCRSN